MFPVLITSMLSVAWICDVQSRCGDGQYSK